jgi:hypothetical protein
MGKKRRQKAEPDVKYTSPEQQEQHSLLKRYQHDQFCKDNLRDLDRARKFLRLMFKPEIIELLDLDNLELASESFLDEELKKLYADVLYRIPVKNGKANGIDSIVVFVLIELKTESDRWTVFQQAKYIIRIWDEEFRKAKDAGNFDQFRLPTVIPVIFHHGEQRFTATTELIDLVHTLKGMEPYTLNVRSLLFDVMTLDEKGLPDDLELVVLIMILQAVFRKDVAERLLAIYLKIRPKKHIPRYQRLWEDCLYYAITSAKNFTSDDTINFITEIRNMGDTSMYNYRTAADDFFDQGVAVGIAQGEARGEANAILDFLKVRYGRLPKSTRDAVRATTDLKALKKLTILAAKCETLEEFNKALK